MCFQSSFNIGLNRTALVIITAGNIVFINKIMQNSIESLGHILFRSAHKWEDPNMTNPPTITNHPTKNSDAKVVPNGPVYTRGGVTKCVAWFSLCGVVLCVSGGNLCGGWYSVCSRALRVVWYSVSRVVLRV